MRAIRPIAIVTALLLVASAAVVPGAVTATSHLTVDVEQDAHGEAAVTVNSSAGLVEGTVVHVTPADANDTYVGSGEYETDASGTVALPAPESDVSVVVEATDGNETASSTVLLLPPTLDVGVTQAEDATATVSVTYGIGGAALDGANVTVSTVDENETYAGAGDYATGADGTVTLPAPSQPVDVSVGATSGDLSGATTATLQNQSTILGDSSKNFGDVVSSFVHLLRGDDVDVPWIGRTVAEFVTENNPGNVPDHAGPKADTGPPEHAGPPGDDDATATSDDDDDRGNNGKADRDDGDRGPPDHAGGNGKAKGRDK